MSIELAAVEMATHKAPADCNRVAKPMLFAGSMVRALLSGAKTQTRRPLALREFKPSATPGYDWTFRDKHMRWHDYRTADLLARRCPFGVVGDRLWVRETWANRNPIYIDADGNIGRYSQDARLVIYRASEVERNRLTWRPSIHMPRWASRLTLEVTEVRVERLRDISDSDAVAEGIQRSRGGWWCSGPDSGLGTPRQMISAQAAFGDRWDAAYAKSTPWSSNPWVWVVCFRRVESAENEGVSTQATCSPNFRKETGSPSIEENDRLPRNDRRETPEPTLAGTGAPSDHKVNVTRPESLDSDAGVGECTCTYAMTVFSDPPRRCRCCRRSDGHSSPSDHPGIHSSALGYARSPTKTARRPWNGPKSLDLETFLHANSAPSQTNKDGSELGVHRAETSSAHSLTRWSPSCLSISAFQANSSPQQTPPTMPQSIWRYVQASVRWTVTRTHPCA
jgi:hypothetical protein